MKKHLFLSLVGALALTACSSDDPMEPGTEGNGTQTEAGTHYLAVNIVSTPSNGKAAGDQVTGQPGEENPSTKYEEGYASENKVTSVRFYFFKADGSAANVRHDNTANYYDWNEPTDDGVNMPNVEKMLKATVVINTKKGDGLPEQIVAVLNPAKANLPTTALSLTDLRKEVGDYVAAATGADGAFVMSNSVYAKGTTEIVANPVDKSNYQISPELAEANPINIYVERNVAKVRVKFNQDLIETIGGGEMSGTRAIALKDNKDEAIKIDGKQVYLIMPNGWTLTAETNQGYLNKHIDPTWAADLFGSEPWNWNPYFRSYWAINPDGTQQIRYSYDEAIAAGRHAGFGGSNGSKDEATEKANSRYTNENAPQLPAKSTDVTGASVEPFTKVLLAGKLVFNEIDTETGKLKEVELCKFAGLETVGVDNLKTLVLQQLTNNGMIYTPTVSEGETKYNSLTVADIEFKTAMSVDGTLATESKPGRYYVYAQLSADAAKKSWTKSNAKDQPAGAAFADADAVNTYLRNQIGQCQIHKGGMTYYYFPIQHLADNTTGEGAGKIGYYGVVRNHIYDCTINTIKGLGTPVFDPSEVIYPEQPQKEFAYIGARINILSWRVVPNNVNLEW